MSQDTLTKDEASAFAAKCKAFLDEHATGIKLSDDDPRDEHSMRQTRAFQAEVAQAGLAGLTYPTKYGGAGLSKEHERIWREEAGRHPDMAAGLIISHGMCLPMMSEYGTDEQRAEYLPDMIAGRKVWCQMFSEPGAGSDVASLQTKAELDGDEWTLNGQKVWTTLAHVCEYGILIARTDPSQIKHAGISMFLVDMAAPGVEIRPIHQIDGGMHFNEVFFTDVRIPKDNLLGPLNDGWRMATAMLMYERVAIGTGSTSGIVTPLSRRLIAEARKNGRVNEPLVRQELMKLYSEETTKSLVSMRTRAQLQSGKTPGPGGSLGKLHSGKIMRQVRTAANRIVGMQSDAWDCEASTDTWGKMIVGSFAANIAGGTDEIQKNIIGDRVLGLPREPSVDKGVAFRDLKVGTQSK